MASKQICKMTSDELTTRWREHIAWVAEEANYVAVHRYRFRQIERWLRPNRRRVANRNLQAYGWIARLWFTEGMMYIRRELDDQHGVINLQQMLHEMEARPDALPGITVEALVADRSALNAGCAEPLRFAQQQVAHRAPMDDPFVSLSGLDLALDSVFHCVRKLYWLHTGKRMRFTGLSPDPEWLQAFTVPWYRPGKRMHAQIRAVERWANR